MLEFSAKVDTSNINYFNLRRISSNMVREKKNDVWIRALNNKGREELVALLKQILTKEKKYRDLLLPKEQQIIKRIKNIDNEDEQPWKEFYDFIPERTARIIKEIRKMDNKKELLMLLFEEIVKLNKKYEGHGATEDMICYMLDELDTIKSTFSKKENEKIERRIKEVLGSEYDEFTCETEDY